MAEQTEKKSEWGSSLRLFIIAYLLAVQAAVIVAFAVTLVPTLESIWLQSVATAVLGLFVLAIIMSAAASFGTAVMRWAVSVSSLRQLDRLHASIEDTHRVIRKISDRLLMSDTTKRIAYRENERQIIRKALQEDIKKGNLSQAMSLAKLMSQLFGDHEEAEDFREQIRNARTTVMAAKVEEAILKLDSILARYDWDQAAIEAAKIQRQFQGSPKIRGLDQRVADAKENHKRHLEEQFRLEAERENVDVAISLLRELDKYLTEEEAAPFREIARGVIGKQRENLGVQFKLAVHDKEWGVAIGVGEQIIREFPNTKMADEVRSMLDLLRERAAGKQAVNADGGSAG